MARRRSEAVAGRLRNGDQTSKFRGEAEWKTDVSGRARDANTPLACNACALQVWKPLRQAQGTLRYRRLGSLRYRLGCLLRCVMSDLA